MTARVHELKLVAAACAIACITGACDEDNERKPLPDWSDGYPDAGGGDGADEPVNAFAIRFPDKADFHARLGQRAALDQPCAIARDDAPAELECLADMNELDPWVLGLKYDIEVPDGMCDFILHVPYMFENFLIGVGPDRVSYTVQANGTFSDQVNAMDGKPYCEFDYTREAPHAPNCCLGNYVLQITSAATGQVTTSRASWGGRIGDCYYGAAYLEKGVAKNADGVPMPRYRHTKRSEHIEHIEYEGASDKFPANITHANYYIPADHADGMPAGLATAGARPYYDAYCLDDAEEVIAHLRLSVREWNEEAEFDVRGDPDTVGVEEDFEHGPIQIDDLADWKALTPGGDSFPKIPVANR
jgi:hypothetical protein